MMVGDGWYEVLEQVLDEDSLKFLDGNNWNYWTRSPDSRVEFGLRYVTPPGAFCLCGAGDGRNAVRPALNLKSDIMVSEFSD